MLPALTLTKEQRIKLIDLITLLSPWEFKMWLNKLKVEHLKPEIEEGPCLIITNLETHEELMFHWYELLTTYLLADLCNKYYPPDIMLAKNKVIFANISKALIDNRLHLSEGIHPIDTVYEHFKQFIKDEKI